MKSNNQNQSNKIAEKIYDPSFYTSNNEVEKGLAITHEQASDSLVEGTIDGKIEDVNGKNLDIPREGYPK
ncbi:YozQ family protein [Bacillus sp. Marseille-P3661]|uniref:YozQ family protein n=1 Tax=Bacillus sp. Marseille-P3661 TaxID=1936234 RepID=UPI000C81B069|nr:YozQ family protein [Bacillus sp. Marseille-P3661]